MRLWACLAALQRTRSGSWSRRSGVFQLRLFCRKTAPSLTSRSAEANARGRLWCSSGSFGVWSGARSGTKQSLYIGVVYYFLCEGKFTNHWVNRMHCYTAHKRIVGFMKIMNHTDSIVCIYPSSDLLGLCCEANLSEPVYSEVSKERFKFQFSVQLMASCCKIIENDGEISATGYSFRDKSDAIESAALVMLDLLMYRYGIRSPLYSDVVFLKDWPAYNHISENLKATCSALMDITSDLSSLIDGIHECVSLFESEKARFSSEVGGSAVMFAVLSDCQAELESTHEFLSVHIKEHVENIRWRCHSHRFYHKAYYKAVHSLHKDLDIKMEYAVTLNAIMNRVCEKSGYLLEVLPGRCDSEGRCTRDSAYQAI